MNRRLSPLCFEPQKFRLYLFSSQPFTLHTDQQAFKSAFLKKCVHGILARWLEVLSEYEYEIKYRTGSRNVATEYLSWIVYKEGDKEDLDEGDLVEMLIGNKNDLGPYLNGLEQDLQNLAEYLGSDEMKTQDQKQRVCVRRRAAQ